MAEYLAFNQSMRVRFSLDPQNMKNMKTFKQLLNETVKDISNLFPKGVITAYIVNNKNDLIKYSVPDNKRNNKNDLQVPIKMSDHTNDVVVVLRGNYDEIFYLIITDVGWELLNKKGQPMHDVPYKSVDINKIVKKINKET